MTKPSPVWDAPQREKRRRRTRRDEIFEFICDYAEQNLGVTPSLRIIASHFGISHVTVSNHVWKLRAERRVDWVDSRIKVEDSTWTPPPGFEHGR